MAKSDKKEKIKREVTCGICGKKVIPNKKSCCPKCGAVIIID